MIRWHLISWNTTRTFPFMDSSRVNPYFPEIYIVHSTSPCQSNSYIIKSLFPCLHVAPHILSLEHIIRTFKKSSCNSWRRSQWCDLFSLQNTPPINGSLVRFHYSYWFHILLIISGLRPLDISVEPRMLIYPSTPLAVSIQPWYSWVNCCHFLT